MLLKCSGNRGYYLSWSFRNNLSGHFKLINEDISAGIIFYLQSFTGQNNYAMVSPIDRHFDKLIPAIFLLLLLCGRRWNAKSILNRKLV